MAQMNVLCLLALAIVGCHGIGPVTPFTTILPVYASGPSSGYQQGPMTLTCAVNFTDPYNPQVGVINAIAVTIRERQQNGYHDSFSPYVPHGGFSGGGNGLSASIEVFSAAGGAVSIAFTEKARPERGCFAEDFGYFYTGEDRSHGVSGVGFGIAGFGTHGGVFGGGYGGGYGGYGSGYGGSYGLNYGYGGVPGYGGGVGLGGGYGGYGVGALGGVAGLGGFGGAPLYGAASGGYGGAPGGGYEESNAPGVVATLDLNPGTASEVNIDNLSGFQYLKDLAGRGVVVCPQRAVDANYHGATCEGGIISCCALHYDMGEQGLMLAHRYP